MAFEKIAEVTTGIPEQNAVILWEVFRDENSGDARYDAFLGYEEGIPYYASVDWPKADQDSLVWEEIGPHLWRVTDHTGRLWEFQILPDPNDEKKFSGYGKHLQSGITIPFVAVFIIIPTWVIIVALIVGVVVLAYCLWEYRIKVCLAAALAECTGPDKVASFGFDGSVCRFRCNVQCK